MEGMKECFIITVGIVNTFLTLACFGALFCDGPTMEPDALRGVLAGAIIFASISVWAGIVFHRGES